jgi:hypothetical protein
MDGWLISNNSNSLKVHINFLHIKLNYFFILLYKFFVVYETQLNQISFKITLNFLIIIITKFDQNLIKVQINI